MIEIKRMKMKLFAGLMVAVLFADMSPLVSAKPPIRFQPLSDVEHHPHGGGHDVRFDHEAFLGKEDAAKFDELTPEESSARLSEIYEKIDTSGDGFVSKLEMVEWIKRVHRIQMEIESMKDFKEHGGLEDRLLYKDYEKHAHYDESLVVPEDLKVYRRQKEKSRNKWNAADSNKDGTLTLKEFMAFSNPIEFKHMHDIYIEDNLVDLDLDGNGVVSYTEYARSRYTPSGEGEENPQWLKDELETMSKNFDKNSDGQYDKEEIRNWLLPHNHDPYEAEMIHLFAHADHNRDNKLTREEVMHNKDIFVGSQATGYGRALHFHEEL